MNINNYTDMKKIQKSGWKYITVDETDTIINKTKYEHRAKQFIGAMAKCNNTEYTTYNVDELVAGLKLAHDDMLKEGMQVDGTQFNVFETWDAMTDDDLGQGEWVVITR